MTRCGHPLAQISGRSGEEGFQLGIGLSSLRGRLFGLRSFDEEKLSPSRGREEGLWKCGRSQRRGRGAATGGGEKLN